MTTFDIDNSQKTKLLEVLESIKEQAHALKYIHNPQTWRLSALTLALHLNDSTILFEEARDRWKKELPIDEAWDVDFAEWARNLWPPIYGIRSITKTEEYRHWENLCDADFKIFLSKASGCINGEVPLNEVLEFLKDKDKELTDVVISMGQSFIAILREIKENFLKSPNEYYISIYDKLMETYLDNYSDNPYPVEFDGETVSFETWIASKTEAQLLNHIPNKINTINAAILDNKTWNNVWKDSVDLENRKINKEVVGRDIFSRRMKIIGNKSYPCKQSLYKLFSSLALFTKLWSYQASLNANAFNELSESRKEIILRLDTLIDKGDWTPPASSEIIKDFIRQVLGVGKTRLFGEEESKSKILWSMLENSAKGERVTFQNLIGYFSFYKLLPEGKGADALNKMFYGRDAETYQNINHGRPGNNQMPIKFESIQDLLNHYRPK